MADLNGDGYQDIVGFGDEWVHRVLGGPGGFEPMRAMFRALVVDSGAPLTLAWNDNGDNEDGFAIYLSKSVLFPLLLQLRHQRDKARIFSEPLQVWIALEQWITREAVVRRRLEPLDRRLSFLHHGISASDVISGMVKVAEALSLFYGAPDLVLSLIFSTVQRCDQGLDAHKQPYVCIPRIIFQKLINYGPRFVSSSEMQ